MFEFTDRVPASGKANRKKITHSDGSVEYVTIENADDANPVGTPLNKATFEAMQMAIMPVVGTYVGNGEAERFIDLGFTPSAVIVAQEGKIEWYSSNSVQGGIALKNNSVSNSAGTAIEINNNGFKVAYKKGSTYSVDTNQSNAIYYYIAFK